MIVEELLTLPPWVLFEGIEFRVELIHNGAELRLGYAIVACEDVSPHKRDIDTHGAWYNTLSDPDNPPFQGFLVLYEGIQSDLELKQAVTTCRLWLLSKKLTGPTGFGSKKQ